MKRYKLLKDLPALKAGSTFIEVDKKDSDGLKLIYQIDDEGIPRCAYIFIDPEKPNEQLEEIKEPIDSIYWKPKQDEKIWYLDENGDTNFTYFDEDNLYHLRRIEFGNTYRTSQECEKARERKLAEVRLRQTSTFEPDFKLGCGGYAIYYDHVLHQLRAHSLSTIDCGEIVRYETYEKAEKSIKENEQDWKIYFGVEEGEK